MPAWQLFYHIVTTTKNRLPLITADIEPVLFRYLQTKAYDLEGIVYAIGGVEDHIHMVVSIPPKISVANFIGQVKGFASAEINQYLKNHPKFIWQAEYGVYSFDKKRMPNFVDYVERQKEHHRDASLIPLLERYKEASKEISESGAGYDVDINFEG